MGILDDEHIGIGSLERILLLGADKIEFVKPKSPILIGQNGKMILECLRSTRSHGAFGNFRDELTNIPSDKIDPDVYTINGRISKIIRWGFDQKSYDDKLHLSNQITIKNLQTNIRDLSRMNIYLINHIYNMPSAIRKQEFEENMLERMRTFATKFIPPKEEREVPQVQIIEKSKAK